MTPFYAIAIFFGANLCYCLAYLVRDIFWLRVLTIVAALSTFPYFILQQQVMYSALFWQSLFVVINLINIGLLLHGQRPVPLTSEETLLKEMVFRNFTSRETAALLRIANWKQAGAEDALTQVGQKLDKLQLLYAGSLKIARGEEVLVHRGPGCFIGEIAYMTGSPSSADVRCNVPSRYVEWDVAELRALLAKRSTLKTAFESLLAVNVAHKLASETAR